MHNHDVGEYGGCESVAEVLVAARVIAGMDGVSQVLAQSPLSRPVIRQTVSELKRVGLHDLAALVQAQALRAKPTPAPFDKRWRTADRRSGVLPGHRKPR